MKKRQAKIKAKIKSERNKRIVELPNNKILTKDPQKYIDNYEFYEKMKFNKKKEESSKSKGKRLYIFKLK